MNFEQAIKDIQDTLVVVAEIQRRQSQVQKVQAEEIDAVRNLLREGFERHEKRMEQHEARMQHVEQNLSEISDKLNGLIGHMEGLPKQPPQ